MSQIKQSSALTEKYFPLRFSAITQPKGFALRSRECRNLSSKPPLILSLLNFLPTFMAEEAPTPNCATEMAEDAATLNPNHSEMTNEATIQSNAKGEHSVSSLKNLESSEISAINDREKSLEFSDELMEKGNLNFKEGDFPEAAELFSRALEIRLGFLSLLLSLCIW